MIIQRIAAELAQNHTEVYANDEIYVHAIKLNLLTHLQRYHTISRLPIRFESLNIKNAE